MALRCGATDSVHGARVMLTQCSEMRDGAEDRWSWFRARQTIALKRPAFRWSARLAPLCVVSVDDALDKTDAHPQVRALRFIPLASPAPSVR